MFPGQVRPAARVKFVLEDRKVRPTRRLFAGLAGYPATMSTSPLDPQEIRAAAEVYRELGPEYDDAVIAAFIDRVDRAVAARVEARLADEGLAQPVKHDHNRRALLKGVAIGACAGALVAGVGLSHVAAAGTQSGSKIMYPQSRLGPKEWRIFQAPGGKPEIRMVKPVGGPPPAPAPPR